MKTLTLLLVLISGVLSAQFKTAQEFIKFTSLPESKQSEFLQSRGMRTAGFQYDDHKTLEDFKTEFLTIIKTKQPLSDLPITMYVYSSQDKDRLFELSGNFFETFPDKYDSPLYMNDTWEYIGDSFSVYIGKDTITIITKTK